MGNSASTQGLNQTVTNATQSITNGFEQTLQQGIQTGEAKANEFVQGLFKPKSQSMTQPLMQQGQYSGQQYGTNVWQPPSSEYGRLITNGTQPLCSSIPIQTVNGNYRIDLSHVLHQTGKQIADKMVSLQIILNGTPMTVQATLDSTPGILLIPTSVTPNTLSQVCIPAGTTIIIIFNFRYIKMGGSHSKTCENSTVQPNIYWKPSIHKYKEYGRITIDGFQPLCSLIRANRGDTGYRLDLNKILHQTGEQIPGFEVSLQIILNDAPVTVRARLGDQRGVIFIPFNSIQYNIETICISAGTTIIYYVDWTTKI